MAIKTSFTVKFLTAGCPYPGYDYALMGNLKIDCWLKSIRFVKNIFHFFVNVHRTNHLSRSSQMQSVYLRKIEISVNQTLTLFKIKLLGTRY